MLDRHKGVCKLVFEHGHAVPIDEPTKEVRKRLKLKEIPPTVHQHPEALCELQKIMELTNFVGSKISKGES
jgi:heterodisulfide reductase subunit C